MEKTKTPQSGLVPARTLQYEKLGRCLLVVFLNLCECRLDAKKSDGDDEKPENGLAQLSNFRAFCSGKLKNNKQRA